MLIKHSNLVSLSVHETPCIHNITICNIKFLQLKYLHFVSSLLHYIDFYKTMREFLAIACPKMYIYLCHQTIARVPFFLFQA
jgi:hypothetical protein